MRGPHSVSLSIVLHILGVSLELKGIGIGCLTAIKHTVKLCTCVARKHSCYIWNGVPNL
jgi:hypothetical protein